MYDEYQSYLNDYKAQNKPADETEQYLNDRHDKMNKNIKKNLRHEIKYTKGMKRII